MSILIPVVLSDSISPLQDGQGRPKLCSWPDQPSTHVYKCQSEVLNTKQNFTLYRRIFTICHISSWNGEYLFQ